MEDLGRKIKEIISRIECDDPYVGLEDYSVNEAVQALTKLVEKSRKEAVEGALNEVELILPYGVGFTDRFYSLKKSVLNDYLTKLTDSKVEGGKK
jgi:hypothetical protein